MADTFLDGKVKLMRGDCLERLKELEPDSIDSCVTDPPYHLTSIVKRFGKGDGPNSKIMQDIADNRLPQARIAKGFMGKVWDGGDIAFNPEVWELVFRALKPGAHLLAFSGTRTYHRMACAIEDAGFEIRDQIGWCYGSGFPKSHDVSKGIDKALRVNGTFGGPKSAAHAGWIERGKMRGDEGHEGYQRPWMQDEEAVDRNARQYLPGSEAAIQWQGWGTALKPAWEPIVLARKPLSESSIAANVMKHGTGAINIDGCRIGIDSADPHRRPNAANHNKTVGISICQKGMSTDAAVATQDEGYHNSKGRWPANLIHDGSEEVVERFPETKSGEFLPHHQAKGKSQIGTFDIRDRSGEVHPTYGDNGSAARFFYTAKADSDDRLGSKHPTVKPVDLIQYLVRLVTPRGGRVLDPFSGTGTTGEAAFREGFNAVLIEREPEYQADIERRMSLVLAGPDERVRETIKAKGQTADAGPLFGGLP